MKKIFIILTLLASTCLVPNISVAQEFGGEDDGNWFDDAAWWDNLPSETGTYIWGGSSWFDIGDGTLLEEVVVEATAIDDYGDVDAWDYDWDSDDWSHYDENGDYWYPDSPYDYHDIEAPYEDEDIDMGIVNTFIAGSEYFVNITALTVSISQLVDNLSDAQLKVLSRFGKLVGGAGVLFGLIQSGKLAFGAYNGGEWDGNDFLVTAAAVLGVGALLATGPLTATVLGVGSLVVSLATETGLGEDWCLINCD